MATARTSRPLPTSVSLDLVRRHSELLIVLGITVLALTLRLWDLGGIPPGVHGDEAQYGMDGQRVLHEGWIGPYTTSALGQPSGIAYVTAVGQALFGATALGARFGVAVFATAAIPLVYVFFRTASTRAVATVAALLMATSVWHLHFSRVAYQPALVPTIELAALILWWKARESGERRWFALAGAMLGLGVYTYTVYPIFIVAFAVWVALDTLLNRRGALFAPWARGAGLAAATAVVVALPLILYALNPAHDFFGHYDEYYDRYSVLRSPEFRDADLGGKVEVIARQVERFAGAYAWDGVTDYVDGATPDERPMFRFAFSLLTAIGVIVALRRWREPVYLLSLTMLAIIPLTSVLQTNSTYRGPLGVVPFVCFLAATPLVMLLRKASESPVVPRVALRAATALLLLFLSVTGAQTYFGRWADSFVFAYVYVEPLSAAAQYVESLPGEPYVYFYAERWSWDYETRLYLAPDVPGEDRSREFGARQDFAIDGTRDAVFVFIDQYLNDAPLVQSLYPTGRLYFGRDGNDLMFIAYVVPKQ